MEIKVNIKYMGKRKKSVEPKIYQLMSSPSTVKELILAVTQAEWKTITCVRRIRNFLPV